jgi:2-amino-4-hydroxy-6-hydroxymethyldihydropteridine pyrophosphokinase
MTCFLGLGSNLGNRQEYLLKAIAGITESIGIISAVSSVCETKSWGFHSENAFLNQVVRVETTLTPEEVLKESQKIEKVLGRENKTTTNFEDRTIDIDILFYEDFIIETDMLRLPHPHLHKRIFALQGLYEIAPHFIHPVLNKSISELYQFVSP